MFPQGLSSIIYAPTESETNEADKIVLAIQSLGNDHPMAVFIPSLQAGIDGCNAALTELHTAIVAGKKTGSDGETIAKLNLTRKYAQNIQPASNLGNNLSTGSGYLYPEKIYG